MPMQQDQVRQEIAEAPPFSTMGLSSRSCGLRSDGGEAVAQADEQLLALLRAGAARVADHAGRRHVAERAVAGDAAPAAAEECAGPCASDSLSCFTVSGATTIIMRGLDLAGVVHAVLVLQELGASPAWPGRNRWCMRTLSAGLAREVRQEGRQRRDVAAVAVDDQHALEAVPLDALQEAEQHRAIGRDVEREGAAEGHVMLGHAAPQRRRHHDRASSAAIASAAAWHTASHRKVSTPTGRCGPCCSIEATGSTTIASACALSRRSAAVSSFHITDCAIRKRPRRGNAPLPTKGRGIWRRLRQGGAQIISTSPCARCSGTGPRSARSR